MEVSQEALNWLYLNDWGHWLRNTLSRHNRGECSLDPTKSFVICPDLANAYQACKAISTRKPKVKLRLNLSALYELDYCDINQMPLVLCFHVLMLKTDLNRVRIRTHK